MYKDTEIHIKYRNKKWVTNSKGAQKIIIIMIIMNIMVSGGEDVNCGSYCVFHHLVTKFDI